MFVINCSHLQPKCGMGKYHLDCPCKFFKEIPKKEISDNKELIEELKKANEKIEKQEKILEENVKRIQYLEQRVRSLKHKE